MQTFHVASYRVWQRAGANEEVTIFLADERQHRGTIDFIEDYDGNVSVVVQSNETIRAFMPLSKLHLTLDILRYEKPVYFSYDEAGKWGALSTGQEPTGEEEDSG